LRLGSVGSSGNDFAALRQLLRDREKRVISQYDIIL
jgi:hypothetical protein